MIVTEDRIAYRYEVITLNAGTVFTTTPAVYTITPDRLPRAAIVGPIEDQAVRFTFHGADPVVATKIGHLLEDGDSVTISPAENIANLRFVREAAVTAYVPITYMY